MEMNSIAILVWLISVFHSLQLTSDEGIEAFELKWNLYIFTILLSGIVENVFVFQ